MECFIQVYRLNESRYSKLGYGYGSISVILRSRSHQKICYMSVLSLKILRYKYKCICLRINKCMYVLVELSFDILHSRLHRTLNANLFEYAIIYRHSCQFLMIKIYRSCRAVVLQETTNNFYYNLLRK